MSENATVTLSESAARQIATILSREPEGARLRVSVSGGGCSGFQYGFTIDDARDDEDLLVVRDGATVVIDPVSLTYLAGSEIDFVDNLMGQYFQVKNPLAVSSCGCGTSFSI